MTAILEKKNASVCVACFIPGLASAEGRWPQTVKMAAVYKRPAQMSRLSYILWFLKLQDILEMHVCVPLREDIVVFDD